MVLRIQVASAAACKRQAYSPLGVQQMIMSLVNYSTPYAIWGSHDKSPESFLKKCSKELQKHTFHFKETETGGFSSEAEWST